MNLLNFLISLTLMSLWMLKQTSAHQYGHTCQHDPSILEKIMPQEYYDSIEEMSKRRKMAGGSPQPFRVTTDASYLDDPANGSGMDSTKKSYIMKIMKAAQMFLKNFIKVIPRSTPIKKRGSATCYDINVPADLQSNGVTNSDLHILVTFENSPNSSALANAVACDYDPGPIVGRIKFNIGTMKNIGTTAQGFESDFATAIHELTHVLGFSSSAMQYWIDPDTNKPYLTTVTKIQVKDTVRGVPNVIKLKSKNVVDTARRYYNCPTLDSVPMENQGGSGSFGSHWERDLIQNEYMTASAILGHAIISEFTAALLVDTGFYAEINSNMLEKGYWGRGKGCDFVNKSCDDTNQQYPEFTYETKDKCDFYSVGQGTLANDPFSQCKVIQDYSNAQCFDDTQMAPNQIQRNNSGPGSKCFTSTSLDKRYNVSGDSGLRCHKYTCSADNSSINVILWNDASLNIQVTCSSQNQVIDLTTVSTNTKGSLTCPSNFALFCTFPRSCTNFCNGNGICSNAVCYCLDGFAGEDCSKSCPTPQVWDGTQCVLNCSGSTFLNPDNTCKTTCPKAYFKNITKNTCDLCHKACSVCTDSSNSSCSECNTPFVLNGTTCQDPSAVVTCDKTCLTCSGSANNQCLTCSDGRFLDANSQCTLCQTPCQNCTNSATKCMSCITDYTFTSSNNTCSPICDPSCLTCSSPKDPTKCLTCSDGYFLSSGKCLKCSSPCSKCVDSASKCLSCITNYTFDNSSNSCNPNCDSSCKTCSQPIDSNSCLSCNDGFYLDGTKCKACSSPCKTCDSSSSKCLSCITNYTYDSTKNICNPNCDSSCKNCSKPIDPNSCISCNDGSFLDGNKCTQCTSPCKTCDISSIKCLSCIADYTYDSSNNICNPNCDSSCKTCSKPKDSNTCLSCNDGFFLDGTKCSICTTPCKTCSISSSKCFSCVANYTFDSSKNQCTPDCDTSCKTCSIPKDANQCLSCNDGAFLDGTKCTLCTLPCKTCDTSSTKCLSCVANYILDGSNNKCNPTCDSSCKTCSKPIDPNQCLSCNDGFFLDGSKCTVCSSPCKTCDSTSTKCLSCIANYTYDSSKNTCSPICDSSCKSCSKPNDPNSCISCNDGSFLDGSKCSACTSPCKTCDTSATKCSSCVTDYTFDSSKNQCNPNCDASCKTCSKPKDANQCLSCNDGSFLDGNKCSTCTSPCKTCDASATKCSSCVTDYTFDSSKNQCNPNCDASCKTCSKPKDSNQCLSCNDGAFLDGTKCTLCTSPCKTCDTSATKCSSCITDYTFDSSKNQCNPNCDTSCKTCSKPKDANQCLSCNDGAFLDGTKCTLCTSPCKTCDTSSSKCLSCIPSYQLDNSSNKCNPTCDSTCKTCSKPIDANQCLSCNDGFFLDGSKCTVCSSPCKTCDSTSTKCLSCVANYTYDSSKNTCTPICDSSCKSCSKPSDPNSCISCNDGSFLDGNKCSACTSPCKTCDTSATKCSSCMTDYTFDSSKNQCNPNCDASCKTCSKPKDSNQCLTCNDGSFLDGNKCSACTSPCKTCDTSATKCTSCMTDYTFDSSKNQCNPNCDASCKSCSKPKDSNQCLTCNDGAFLDGTKCTLCTSPCKTCDTSATKCSSCITDYTFDSSKNQCNPNCDASCKTCSKPKDANQCLSCNEGFFLEGSKCTACTQPCKTCSDKSNKCLSCIANYTFDSVNNVCVADCDISCKTCQNPKDQNSCLSCNDGFFLDGSKCSKCASPCNTCETQSQKCLSCIINYTLDLSKNICNPSCDSSCKSCVAPKDPAKCQECYKGFYLSSGQCVQCSSPCKECTDSDSKCISCLANYNFDSLKNICTPICDSSCKTCSQPQDSTKCTSCQDGNFLLNGKCSPCKSPCSTCENKEDQCLSCIVNFTFDHTINSCKADCDSSCKSCSLPKDSNSCLSCQDGYFLSGKQCLPCSSPCKSCNISATTCLSCISDTDYQFKSATNKCEPICDSTCQTCSEPKNPFKCTSCNDGTYLNSNQCQKCQAPCLTCKNLSTQCLSCIDAKYTYDSSTNTCKSNCHISCKTCSNPDDANSCSSCFDGSFLNGSTCQQCQSPCQNCQNSGSNCLSCVSGYQFKPQNTCEIVCASQCKTCSKPLDSKSCTSCPDGYFLSGTECLPCQAPCQNCVDSANKCLSCISSTDYKYISSNNQCQMICDSTCKTCNEPNNLLKCLDCPDGSYLINGQCKKCTSPCGNCQTSPSKCLSCISADYTLNNSSNTCEPVCDKSCKLCSSPQDASKCTSCQDGFYLDGGICRKCSSPCSKCIDNDQKCTQCIDNINYKFDAPSNKCIKQCHSSCKECSDPQDISKCISCNDGFYLDSGYCKKCISPCNTCKNLNECQSCETGYTFDATSSKCQPQCDTSCLTCSKPNDQNSCLSCKDGSFLNNSSQCLPCKSPCSKCNGSADKCTSCITNYNLDNSSQSCSPTCDSSCKTCSEAKNASKCLSCNDGFYLDSGLCKKCISPCSTCKSSSECLTCENGYTFDVTSSKCQPQCDSSCLTCNKPNDSNSCLSCKDGSFLNNLSQCLPCKSPCLKCIGQADKCTSCITNYNLDNSSQSCSPICDSSCKTCSEAKNASKCLSCNDGFYLDSGLCKKCISPCSTCKNSSECLTCENGYTFDATSSKCQPQCDSSCLTCNKPNDSNSCLTCKDGSFLNNLSQCLPCKSPCQKCSVSADKCTSCIINYNLNISLQSCSPICDSSCKTCSEAKDSSKCLSCQDGYFLVSNTCQKCKQPCQTCQDQSDKCLSCISSDFTYDASQFKCKSSCHTSCKTCSGPSQSNCTSCFDSYYLDNNQCKACLSPCDNCSQSQDNCTSCINGYTLNTNKCEINCDSTCQTCSAPKDSSSCTSCKDGFYLDKGKCKPCLSPCSKCSNSETQCTDCISNYKLESNQCKPVCDKSCKSCSNPVDSNSCLSCFDGYYLSGSQCLKCNSPCATCVTNSSKCLTCQTGYQISQKNPNTCEPQCDSSCLTCSSNSNPNACLSCPEGRYLENNQCKPCPVNCLTCTSFSKCQSCKQNYGLDLKTQSCQLICDKSCLSCSQPNNPKACLSCTSNKILTDGSCQDCPQGQYFNFSQCSKCSSNCKVCKDSYTCDICEDGYSLDSKKSCKQNTQSYKCHYTCNTCSGTSYSQCTSCVENRVLNNKSDKTKSSQIVGTCDCPSGTSDFNQPFCDQSKIQETIKTTATAFLISSGSTTTVLAIASANPLILGSLIEFSQTISFFTYVNEKPALGFDDVAQNLYIAHITKIFNFNGMRKNKSQRLLESTSTDNQLGTEGFNNNSKIPLNDKYPEFVVNALAILVLTGLSWLLSALTSIITISDPNSFTAKIKKVFCISFTICIFVLTSQEFSLLIFFQFQQLGMENSVDTASAFLSFITFAYILGFLSYLFYKLNYQQVLTKPMFIAHSALKTSAKIHPIFGVDISQAKEEKTITNPDYYTFYILHLYIKQNSFLNRAFIQIIVIRKIVTSIIMTFGYQNPITQVSILLVLYLTYWLYIILSRPFKQVKHMILYSVIETITLSMYILYLVLLNNESDNEKQKTISLVMLILILVALLFYLLVSFIYLVLFAVQCLKKCGEKHNDIAVVNVSNHFEKDQSQAQFNQQPIQESKIYTKPLDLSYNPSSQQHKMMSYMQQDKINYSVTNNQSIIQENQNLSKQIISDTVFLESPVRSKTNINIQQQQQQNQENVNTTNRIRLIQGYQIDKLQPQDDILPEKISQSKIPDIFNEPLNYSRVKKAKKFQDIF